jgi:tRNA A-37 threonylcarbamoyl transferase component Bud32
MGAVYRVHQVMLGKDFALKVLDLHQRSDVTVRRFQQEARTASQLQHPNLVEVHDFGVFGDDQPYLVMDLVEGQTLAETLKKSGTLAVDYVVALCIQVCFGLMYAHDKGVVHRDIKPGNIMLLHADRAATEGSIKIVDFGIAKITQSEDGEIQALTKTGEIFGSPVYMSPEQCKGMPVDRRSDIYSLGCVVYECLTGTPPFVGDSAMATMLKRLSEEPATLKEASFGREFPAQLEAIVRKMLEVDPQNRYQDLGVVIKDLMALQRPEHLIPVSLAVNERANRRHPIDKKFVALLAFIFVATSFSTATFDRYFVFPSIIAAKSKEEVDWWERLEKNRRKEDKKYLAGADAAEDSIDIGISNFPRLETKIESSGAKSQILFFPLDCGLINIDGSPPKRAHGKFLLSPNSRIMLGFKHSIDPEGLLNNITELNFEAINYSGNPFVTDKTIEILAKIKRLSTITMRGCDIHSLKPLYESTTLVGLQLEGTKVQTPEILKLKALSRFLSFTVGPLKDPAPLFKFLAKKNTLVNFSYKGARADNDYPGAGLEPDAVAALSKITALKAVSLDACPKFNDDSLVQILSLRNLHALVIRDCGVTAKSIPTFRKFPNLELLHITVAGWSDAEKRALLQLPFKVEFKESKLQSINLNQ